MAIPPKPYDMLRYLVENPGRLVTQDELLEKLWPETYVNPELIRKYILDIRKILGDRPDKPKFIETVTKRGYRFIAPVIDESATPPPELGTQKQPLKRDSDSGHTTVAVAETGLKPAAKLTRPRWIAIGAVQAPTSGISQPETRPALEFPRQQAVPEAANGWLKATVVSAAVVILAFASYISWRRFRAASPPKPKKIMLAVLPFQNLTGDSNKEYVADGLTEETISQLGRLNPEQLGVIARTSVMGYKHKDVRLDQIGRDLSVQYVLENSLRENGDHLRLTAQLIQVKDQSHLWSQDYDYPAKDILNVEDDVAKAVTREIRVRLSSQQQEDLARSRPVNPEAFNAYLQGNQFLRRNDEMAARYYERSTQLDPSYARAWIGLSKARYRLADSGRVPVEEGKHLSREAVEQALALEPNLAAAHAQMGEIKQWIDFDWAGGDAFLQHAVALDPGNSEIVSAAARSAAHLGRFDEGLRLAHRSVELDPLNAKIRVRLAQIECWMGAQDEALADFKRGIALDPDVYGRSMLSEIHVLHGEAHVALAEIERESIGPIRLEHYAITYHALGRKKESDAALGELIKKYPTTAAFQIAEVYGFRHQPDQAFEWLDRAYAQRDGGLDETKVDPFLKSLHNDPRFAALLKKLNLPS